MGSSWRRTWRRTWRTQVLVLAAAAWLGARAEQVRYLEVSENAAPGTRVGFIDADSPPYLIVPVPGSFVESDLVVDGASGEIRTRVALDRESRPSYSLVALPQNVRVVVRVLDENDNAPSFGLERVRVEFPENSPRDTKRALPPARDPDLGPFTTQRYEIVEGNSGDAFRLAAQRGRDGVLYLDLQLSGALDREAVAEYSLVVEALDGGAPPLGCRLRVDVAVQDANDNPPVFERSRYEASVPENATVGTPVARLGASDADAGDNGRIEYSINRRQSDRDEMFRIDPDSGLVSVNKPLDFESRERHELVVVARDRGAQPLEASAFLSVRVSDVNDNQPAITVIFLSDDATPKISEAAQPGEFVARISVSDPDSRAEYSNASVSLTGGEGHFGLATRDNIVYLVLVGRPLDREQRPAFELALEATDAGTPPLRATRAFRLLVTDVNDNAPVFERERYEAHVLEAAEPGTSVARLRATDRDEGDNARITYSLLNSSRFAIDAEEGVVRTAAHVDCDADPQPLLVVVASDRGRPPLSASATLRVTVHDVNDNEPIFDRPLYNVTVSEDLPLQHCFLKVSATDADCGVNAMVNYTLAPGTSASEKFLVRSDSGEICIRVALDREATDYHELPVIATDRGGLSTTTIVRVLVNDVNDNRPIFHPHEYNVTLRADSLINGPILRCSAIDMDAGIFGQVSYRISAGNEAGIFRIDRATGEIHVARPSRLMRAFTYLLNITANDAAGLTSVMDATVRIITTPSSQRIASCDRPRYNINVKENVAQNTFIGSLRDPSVTPNPGNALYRFHLVTEESDLSVEASTGAIRTRLPLDREIRDRYILSIEVHNDIHVGYCQVEITVEDVNDNPPAFVLNNVRISVAESQPTHRALYIARASDPDVTPTVALRYSLSQDGNELFGIEAASGEVYLVRQLDYETQQHHRLVVSAFDGTGLSANLSLSVEVHDVNDNPPVFERNEYFVELSEAASVNSLVVQVTAVDIDTGNNARLSYRLQGSDLFHVNPNSGWIALVGQLDRETSDRYSLTVLATDNGSPAATASASVLVAVLDDNDNPPRFDHELYEFELSENLPPGVLIGKIQASDPDFGKNAQLKYAIIQSNSSFAVDPDTGVVTTRESLDREMKAVHELVLEARDQGTPSRAARVPVKVSVLDVNDNSPEIVDPQGDVVSVREEQPPGTEVARIRALDKDLGENASVTYTILKDGDSDGYNVFNIDPISGMIKTKVVLDHEERNVYRLSVKASDAGRLARHSVRVLRVEVLALADNRPTFTSSSLTFNVREDASIGEAVGSVSGSGPAGRVAYTLDSLRPHDIREPAFDVDRVSGQLVVARALDRENISSYQLEIRSLDTSSIGNPQSIAVSVRINIEDVNDNPPEWPQDPLVIRVSERAPIGFVVYNLSASDLDDGPNGDLRYSLVAEYPPTGSFAIDSITGALSLVRALDYEQRFDYTIVIKAEDRAPPGEQLATTVTAKLFVLDHNDNSPVFVSPNMTKLPVTSDVLPGTSLVRVLAVDKDAGDNGRVSYVINSGNEDGYFSIGYESGLLSLVKPMMHTTELGITASDHGEPARKASLKLTLTPATGQSSSPPRLLLPNPTARLSENLRVGADVISVAGAAALDQANVSFSIPKGVAFENFGVSSSGVVQLLAPLDREKQTRYSVPVLAHSNKLLDLTTLEIFVLDENDNNPEFSSGSCYTLTIPENQESAAVHTLSAMDVDEGKNGEISYSIITGNVGSKFKLDPLTGVLTTSNLDRELVPKYVLMVSAKDKGRPSLETRCNITVIVLDLNDNAPVFVHNQFSDLNQQTTPINEGGDIKNSGRTTFTQGKYSTTVSEDVPAESSIMQVQATDPDQGVNGKITYSIAEETTWLFRVDNLTGVISTVGPLDHERQSFYSFLVVATDNGKYEARQTSVPVEVYIADANDNYPVFDEYPYQVRVPVSTQPGQNVLRIKASDADAGANGEIVYAFAQETEQPKFRIHSSTGVVSVTSSLSQENGRVYHLEVVATDKGDPPLSARGLIELRIGDLSDLAPVLKFQNDSYDAVVQENSDIGTELLQVTAVRSDGRRQYIAYSIGSGNDQQVFSIDEETGVIKVNNSSKLDAELCMDTWYETSFDEDKYQNRDWLNTMENKQSNEKMKNGAKYVLTLVARTVGAEPLEAYAKLIVWISDVNDNAPIFTQSQYSSTVLEGNDKGDFVIKLSASDMDQGLNSKLLYHIVDGNPDNAFTINPPYSGIVRTNIVLDREIRENYRLTIIATDQGTPQLTGTTALNVRVIDVNDNQPTFPEHKTIFVSEDTALGTVLTTITANDVDSSPALIYRFANISQPGIFNIDRFGGRVVLTSELDAEKKAEYVLHVVASDGLHEVETQLTIGVIDLNDNPPRFEQAAYITTLSEERGNIQEVLTVNATDHDLTEENRKIRYRLLHPMKGFTVHSINGALIVNRTALPRPLPKEIELAIIAEDSGKPSLSSTCSVIVRLNGLKSNFPGREYKISIKENAMKGTSLMKLSDIDLLDGIIIAGNDNGIFEVSRGKLILAKVLDRESKDSYILQLGAKDENSTKGSLVGDDPVMVIINVDDVNDNYPLFIKDLYKISIKEDALIGHTIDVLRAEDDDLPGSPAATIVYEITSGNDRSLFHAEKFSGAILVNATLDCDLGPGIYHLVVMACDSDPVNSLCSLARLQIELEDVNDNSPKFPVSEYLGFVGENEPIGTTIFAARASDLDRGVYGAVEYTIVSAATSGFSDIDDSWKLFSVDTKSGAITTRTAFDYEQRNRYAFTLLATDAGGRTATVRVRIEIDSRDEFYPQFTKRIYRFVIRIEAQIQIGTVIGYVTATDRDKGPDGRVVYQLTSQHPFFKLNRTTGAVIVKQKLTNVNIELEESSRLIVTASSGKQGSLSNMTVIELSLIDSDHLTISHGITAFATPTNVGANMAVATNNSLADWAISLLIALLLLLIAFGSILLYLHVRSRRHKKPGSKPGLNGGSNVTTSNSYVDSSAFDTIPIRSVAGIVSSGTSGIVNGNGESNGSCQFAPPKYDEIPPYGTSGQSGTHGTSELSGSDRSGSSGRGSAEDDGDDEEIRMINEGQQMEDSASDLSVHNTQEYLARLGIVDPPISTPRRPPEALPLNSLHLFEDQATTEADIATLIYGKINDPSRPMSGLDVPGGPSMNGSLSSIVHSEEELTGSYNWDYLLDWGPHYQPLAHVFSEIARLKDDSASIHSGNSGSSSKIKFIHKAPPPPLLTSVAPRSLTAPAMTKGMLPRSPISHDVSAFPSAALSPSFSPSLSPLATRSPSISPLVPTTTSRNQCPPRGMPISDEKLGV